MPIPTAQLIAEFESLVVDCVARNNGDLTKSIADIRLTVAAMRADDQARLQEALALLIAQAPLPPGKSH